MNPSSACLSTSQVFYFNLISLGNLICLIIYSIIWSFILLLFSKDNGNCTLLTHFMSFFLPEESTKARLAPSSPDVNVWTSPVFLSLSDLSFITGYTLSISELVTSSRTSLLLSSLSCPLRDAERRPGTPTHGQEENTGDKTGSMSSGLVDEVLGGDALGIAEGVRVKGTARASAGGKRVICAAGQLQIESQHATRTDAGSQGMFFGHFGAESSSQDSRSPDGQSSLFSLRTPSDARSVSTGRSGLGFLLCRPTWDRSEDQSLNSSGVGDRGSCCPRGRLLPPPTLLPRSSPIRSALARLTLAVAPSTFISSSSSLTAAVAESGTGERRTPEWRSSPAPTGPQVSSGNTVDISLS